MLKALTLVVCSPLVVGLVVALVVLDRLGWFEPLDQWWTRRQLRVGDQIAVGRSRTCAPGRQWRVAAVSRAACGAVVLSVASASGETGRLVCPPDELTLVARGQR